MFLAVRCLLPLSTQSIREAEALAHAVLTELMVDELANLRINQFTELAPAENPVVADASGQQVLALLGRY
jgi:hypothetical protein